MNRLCLIIAPFMMGFASCSVLTEESVEIAFYVAPDGSDFTLPENSPAFQIGFKPFPLDQAGPRNFTP